LQFSSEEGRRIVFFFQSSPITILRSNLLASFLDTQLLALLALPKRAVGVLVRLDALVLDLDGVALGRILGGEVPSCTGVDAGGVDEVFLLIIYMWIRGERRGRKMCY
jgi:hypothetical protein